MTTALHRQLNLLLVHGEFPIRKGVKLLGITDSTGFLKDGEVFTTFDAASFIEGSFTELNNHNVLVIRSPALDVEVSIR